MSSSGPSASSGFELGASTSQGKDLTPIETPAPPSESIALSDEQKNVLQRVELGENVFFTGSAGG